MRRIVPLLALLVLALAPAPAGAASSPGLPIVSPPLLNVPPPGFQTTASQAIAIADRTPQVRAARRDGRALRAQPYVWDNRRWEIDYSTPKKEFVEVDVSAQGTVTDVWTGIQTTAYFTRDFADQLSSKWLFALFALLFAVPFVDRRRLRSLRHLDLIALLSFAVPFYLLDARHGTAATLSLYGPLLYLTARMLSLGLRPRNAGTITRIPATVLLVGVVALFAGRVALNVHSDKVIDIGFASVVGADRIEHKQPLYVDNDAHGDTYGPVSYIAYIPFELALPFKGTWDSVPAAHAAAIVFDLLTILALFVLGTQLRVGPEGRRLGLVLAWAWCAFPFTLFTLLENTNDGLVAMLVAWSLVALRHAGLRGMILGLAAAAKFFPLALLGAVWRGTRGWRTRDAVLTTVASVGVVAVAIALYLPAGGLREFWNCTLGFQLSRPPDFSIWGLYGLGGLQRATQVAAVALAIAVGFFPRGPRSVPQVAALAAAVTLAVQLGGGHWFFFYVTFFAPLVLVAILGAQDDAQPEPNRTPVVADEAQARGVLAVA